MPVRCSARPGGVRIWCLRHAEAETVTTDTITDDPNPPLSARGRRQAAEAARALADEPITRIYASTMLRARQTADFLAAGRRCGVTAMEELAEVGVSAEVLRAWVVEQDFGRRAADGETGNEVITRVTAAFERIAGAHPAETVVVVGHVASLTVALGRLCSLGPVIWGTPLPHAQPFLVEYDGGAWRCPAWPAIA
jgi:alpha-ribazole phosphatase/probable phosphoglycerate mutase